MMKTLVEVRGLTKQYLLGGPKAVDDLSFEIHKGEILGLLGPNGAGKTTMINMLSTLIPPTAGKAFIAGHSIHTESMTVRRNIGVVPQDLALYDDLSALENLRFWGEMRGLRGATLQREIQEKLHLIELNERARDRVEHFSGGMKRRLNLAIGLLGNPPLVMLDEPTVGIDPQSRRYILDWVKTMRSKGLTVLYTTHYMEEAQELSDRIGIIDHGKLIALGTLDELIRQVGTQETLVLNLANADGVVALVEDFHDTAIAGQIEVVGDMQVMFTVASAEAALPLILARAGALDVVIRTIEIHQPNLESVFLHLTGRALRD